MNIENHPSTQNRRELGNRKKGWWGRYLERLSKLKQPISPQTGSGCKH